MFQVCKGSLTVIARSPTDAVRLYTRLSEEPGEPPHVRDMEGRPIAIGQLRKLSQQREALATHAQITIDCNDARVRWRTPVATPPAGRSVIPLQPELGGPHFSSLPGKTLLGTLPRKAVFTGSPFI
jgi:hypothetical protein